jgi:hypothetical protein
VTSKSWGPNAFRYKIELTLSSRVGPSSFTVSAEEGGLRIIPRDVDGDGDLDLVITSARSFTPVGVWINDGHGGFTQGDATAYSRSFWTEGPGIDSGNMPRIFAAITNPSSWSWLNFSKGFRLGGELPAERARLYHATSNLPEVAAGQPQTRAPPYSLTRQTN